jgi:methylated-DNA-[protein]-cysteine S-methyltransferase
MTKPTCDLLVYTSMETSIAGKLWLAATEHGLCAIDFGGEESAFVARLQHAWGIRPLRDGGALQQTIYQLDEYFAGKRSSFDLPLDLRQVTPFRRQVLEATLAVPSGQTVTYGELAQRIGRPHAARAVGGAQATNPIPIIVPCHRVVGSDGSLTGYGGGMAVKEALLKLEGAMLAE